MRTTARIPRIAVTPLTRSPRLQLVGTEAIGADTLELFWRR